MKHVGTTNSALSIVTKAYVDSKGGGSTALVTSLIFGQEKNVEDITINVESGELYDTDEVVIYRYTTSKTGDGRKHGWIRPLNAPVLSLTNDNGKWKVSLSHYRNPITGNSAYGDLRTYEREARAYNESKPVSGHMVSLGKKCAFAIIRNGVRISDFMHFRVQRNHNKKTGIVRYDLARW